MASSPMLGDVSGWSLSIQTLEVDQEQPLWYGNDNYDDVIDRTTGGMFITAQRYNTSFWIEGAKYIDMYPPYSVMVVYSTSESNVEGRYESSKPYKVMSVWRSFGDGHTRAGGKGMDVTPGDLDKCVFIGRVEDVFADVDFTNVWSLEDVFRAAAIENVVYFIGGYHIHGIPANVHDKRYCALDWYGMTSSMRARDPNVWTHWVVLDEVSPEMIYRAKEYRRMEPYEGWHGHRIGGQTGREEDNEPMLEVVVPKSFAAPA